MQPDISKFSDSMEKTVPTLPIDYRGGILRGATISTVSSVKKGLLILQEFSDRLFSISFLVFNALRPFSVSGTEPKTYLVSILAISKNIRYSIKGLGKVHLKQGQFALVHTRGCEVIANFAQKGMHEALEISWSEELVREMMPAYSKLLQPLVNNQPKKNSFFLGASARPAGIRVLDVANEILHAPYDDETGKILFENKVREYLLEMLVEASKEPPLKVILTQAEREKIIAIGKEIRSQPDKKFPISQLSRQVGVNSMKLKDGFKEIHGQGIFEHHMEARMEEARRLIMETDFSMKQISAMIGYKFPSSFISQFKKHFGYYASDVPRSPR